MDLHILQDVIVAMYKVDKEDFETRMQMLAWQTALLMNSTGNYKKKIKAEDLYSVDVGERAGNDTADKTKTQLQEELLQTFAGSM